MLDRLLKISSLSGALLIFCGVLKLIIYYSAFNIRIVEFLSFSEIVTSFLDDINVLIIFCVAFTLQSIPTINFLHERTKSPLTVIEWFDIVMLQIYPHKIKYVIFFATLIAIGIILISLGIIAWNYWIIYVMVFCIIQALTFLLIVRTPEWKIDLSGLNAGLILCIALISAIVLLAERDIQATKLNKYSAVIKASDSIYVCNESTANIYVGKTDNFLFIHSKKDRSSICIPTSEIKLIQFK